MKTINLDEKWTYRKGYLDSITMLEADPGVEVDLPHDGMIETQVSPDAPAKHDSGYYNGGLSNYTKYVFIPKEWENECIGLKLDGVMMNATIDVNGSRVSQQHNGYMPFYADLTDYVTFGEENRITINVNTSMQPNSRWYTGSGLYRGVKLMHGHRIHIVPDGIYAYTKEVDDGYAFVEALVEVENSGLENRLAQVTLSLFPEENKNQSQSNQADEQITQSQGDQADLNATEIQSNPEKEIKPVAVTKSVIYVVHGKKETARMSIVVKEPKLWDAEQPNLYRIKAEVTDLGVYRTHFIEDDVQATDCDDVLFGIRTVSADPIRGLLINKKSVKLKGGCLHHDNGLIGAVTLAAVEERKIKKLKELGFNAIRTAHNPPSKELIEACDRIGMYVFDEAFDSWLIGKRGGDYHQFFEADWEKDLTAFIKRDRTHPCVILWSTGNEIPERGGLGEGYTRATKLAETIRSLDASRPVSNGICSFWSGLDDKLAVGQNQAQNAGDGFKTTLWEIGTEPFTNGLDVVGYNYMEEIYERDHDMFPDRVILGSENFPKQIGFRWPMVENTPYVIGDFTWTAWDYIGEAGLGKAAYVEPTDPDAPQNPWNLMPDATSPYPWRLANDADFDITGRMLPQGEYRSIVWGSDKTFLYSMHPDTFDKKEIVSMWGFPYVLSNWNYAGYEGKPIELVVFSGGDEVEVLVNGNTIGEKPVEMDEPMPYSVRFETVYQPGEVVAISYKNGNEISRDTLLTTKEPSKIRLVPEKEEMNSNGHDIIYVAIEIVDSEGNVVPDAEIKLKAEVEGVAKLTGFGSANPITEENYVDEFATTYRGRAMAVIRSGYENGNVGLTVSAEGFESVTKSFTIQ